MSLSRFLASPHLLLLLTQLFWAGNAIAGRFAVGEIPPVALAFWRWVLALLILAPFALPRVVAQRRTIARHWPFLALMALTSVAMYTAFLYLALISSSAVNITLIAASTPVVIVLLAWLWLGARPGRLQLLGVLVSLAGVLLVIARGNPLSLVSFHLNDGDLWVLGAVAGWAIYSVLLRRHPLDMHPLALIFTLGALGLLWMFPAYLAELFLVGGFSLTLSTAGLIVFVAIFPSLLAYAFWNRGVISLGPQKAGLYLNLVPVFTGILGALLLGEPLFWFHGAGMALIFLGIWAVSAKPG